MSVLRAMVRAMLMLHTSDWHLGRSLHRADLRAAQAAFLDHLVETVRAERGDVVLAAGRGGVWWWSRGTSTTGPCLRWTPSSCARTPCSGCTPPGPGSC